MNTDPRRLSANNVLIIINITGRLPENRRDRGLWPSMELKQLKKKDRQIDHQSFNRPIKLFGLDSEI